VRPDGERRYVASRGDVVEQDGRVVSLSGICQDLTERQRLLDALREADRLKDEFLSVVSHELRTPLASIIGFGRLLHEAAEGDARTWSGIVMRNAEEVHGMVERILDYSRFQHGRVNLHIAPFRARDLVDRVLPLVASPLAQHELRTEIDDEIDVLVDRQAMDRILVNLLTNSAKFSPPHSTVQLQVVAAPEQRTVRFRVVDEGCGIPSDELEAVFERFHQVASDQIATRHGVGVGLAIVKGYAEAMGGSVWIESELDRGTAVTVELPMAG
jgi:signal transduction histidine kinase